MRDVAEGADVEIPRLHVVSGLRTEAPRQRLVQIGLSHLRNFDDPDLHAAVAHEAAHVIQKPRAVAIARGSMAAALIVTVAVPALVLGSAVLLPAALTAVVAEGLALRTVMRHFEYEADAFAAHVIGSPLGMAAALEKLHGDTPKPRLTPQFWDVRGVKNWFLDGLLHVAVRTLDPHPTYRKRIARLQRMPGGKADPYRLQRTSQRQDSQLR